MEFRKGQEEAKKIPPKKIKLRKIVFITILMLKDYQSDLQHFFSLENLFITFCGQMSECIMVGFMNHEN